MNDTTITAALIFIIICHIAILAIGYKMQKTTVFISYLNAIIGIGIFILWAIDSLSTKQPKLELSVLFVGCVEALIFLFALYSIIGFYTKTWVKILNYIGFGMHVLATSALLYYILTFNLNKLF